MHVDVTKNIYKLTNRYKSGDNMIVQSDRFEINNKNKLSEDGRIVYAQIGRDLFELKHVKTLGDPETLMQVLNEHTVYLLCDSDGDN